MKGYHVRVGRTGVASPHRVITCDRTRRTAARSYLVVIRRATFFDPTGWPGALSALIRAGDGGMLTVETIDEGRARRIPAERMREGMRLR